MGLLLILVKWLFRFNWRNDIRKLHGFEGSGVALDLLVGEFDDTGCDSKKGVVIADFHVCAWSDGGAALANDNATDFCGFTSVQFNAKALTLGIATVACTSTCFFMGHILWRKWDKFVQNAQFVAFNVLKGYTVAHNLSISDSLVEVWYPRCTRNMAKSKEELTAEIEKTLDVLREGIAMHSGNVELVDVDMETGKVSVRFQGMCVGCPMSDMTLKVGIEETLREMVPEVTEVVAVA